MKATNTTNVAVGASHHRSERSVLAPMRARVGPFTPVVANRHLRWVGCAPLRATAVCTLRTGCERGHTEVRERVSLLVDGHPVHLGHVRRAAGGRAEVAQVLLVPVP